MGAGAAKLGKKAAQSEAGRSAGRAAVAGATEGVKQDLTNRYFGPGEAGRSPSPQPNPPPAAAPPPSSSSHSTHTRPDPTPQPHRAPTSTEPRPPKPSLLNRFKPHIGKSSSEKPSHRRPPRRQTSRQDKIYKYNLSKEANWDDKLRVQTLYNYKAERSCDLEFRKGQILQVLTRTDNQFDWWEGNLDGRVGIFPANYVKIL